MSGSMTSIQSPGSDRVHCECRLLKGPSQCREKPVLQVCSTLDIAKGDIYANHYPIEMIVYLRLAEAAQIFSMPQNQSSQAKQRSAWTELSEAWSVEPLKSWQV